jgi:hypothetical protein
MITPLPGDAAARPTRRSPRRSARQEQRFERRDKLVDVTDKAPNVQP